MALNSLLADADRVLLAVSQLKARARQYYHAVQLSRYRCPDCDGALQMMGPSYCVCSNGHGFDPTVMFQRCPCRGAANLRRRQCHYACVACSRAVPSNFLFDERLPDATYFRDRMREHRRSRARKRREVARWLRERSAPVSINVGPDHELAPVFAMVDGLLAVASTEQPAPQAEERFDLRVYASRIVAHLAQGPCSFMELPAITVGRVDIARRFMTVMVLSQEGCVDVEPFGNDLLVSLR